MNENMYSQFANDLRWEWVEYDRERDADGWNGKGTLVNYVLSEWARSLKVNQSPESESEVES